MEVHKICSHFEDPLEPKTMETTLKRPWCGWQDNVCQLKSKFQLDENEHNIIRNTNSNHTSQNTKYAEMTNSSQECMRDSLNTEVHNPTRI